MLNIFNFNNYSVRVVVLDGEVWFVAIDVAKILEYTDVRRMCDLVEDEDKRVENPHNLGVSIFAETFSNSTFRVSLINESGVYSVIFNSTKPEAKVFKKWVTSELLPTIRKTGSYTVNAESVLDRALNLLEKNERRLEENEKGFKQAMTYISVLEEEKFDREFYLEKINEITKEHPLFKSLIELKMLIKLNSYSFPSLDYSIRDLSLLFITTKITPRDLAFYSSHLYFLDYGEKPRKKEGHYTYNGKDLIYPLLVLFRLEGFSWEDLRNSLEIDYLVKFPTSNRGFLPQGN